jgi:hypothetical protein
MNVCVRRCAQRSSNLGPGQSTAAGASAALRRSWRSISRSARIKFWGWKEREEANVFWKGPDTYDPLVVYFPKTWLLSQGWLKHGRISFHEVPSERAVANAS